MDQRPTYDELQALVHELRDAQRELEATKALLDDELARWRLLIEQSRDGIVVLDEDLGVHEANRQFARMLGYSPDEVKRLHVWDWDHLHSKEQVLQMFHAVDGAGQHFETQHRRKDGTIIDVELSNNGAVYRGQKLVFCVCRDITQSKRAEKALRESEQRFRELSVRDELTQLFNRRYFYEQLDKEIERATRHEQALTLLLLDLDDFKRFNDTYGHVEGDRALSRLGQVITGLLRRTDSGFRYGGEEFSVLLPHTSREAAVATAERLRQAFSRECLIPTGQEPVHLTISIGVAEYRPGEDSETFVRRADQLLYAAKDHGRDRVCS